MKSVLLFLIALGWLAGAATPAGPPLRKKVLILGIDGTMPSALAVAQTPNLNALKLQGTFSDQVITHPVTHSAACWSAMFTGVWGDKNGVNYTNNAFTGSRFDLYPSFFKRLEDFNPALNTMAFTRWPDIKAALGGTDGVTNFNSDAELTTATCRQLTNADPDVFFTILLDVDSAGHNSGWGPTVTNYVKAIETADLRVGEMLSALTNRVSYAAEDWLVILLTDHGQHDSTLERARLTFQLVTGPSAGRGSFYPTPTMVDPCATVLTHMGVPIDPAWNLDARVAGLPLPPAWFGTNLLFNGNAEANSGTNSYTPNRCIAWWWDHDSTTLGVYGSNPEFPDAASPGPSNRGRNFFLGGTNSASMTQTLSLDDLAEDLLDPGADYQLSGWFGGKREEGDEAWLSAVFLDETGQNLGETSVGPVTAADRADLTGLLERSTNGTLPSATRLVRFTLTMRMATPPNDALADNLSFVLTPRLAVLLIGATPEGWQVACSSRTNRLYRLDRSEDLTGWTSVSPWIPGTGDLLTLTDTNAPTAQAFYRVAYERP